MLIGIGSVSSQMKDIAKSFKEATTAIEVGAVFDTEKNIISFENLGIGRSDLSAADHAVRNVPQRGVQEGFDRLARPGDPVHHPEVLRKQSERSETSRKLFVHRNTLVYRLEKIKN